MQIFCSLFYKYSLVTFCVLLSWLSVKNWLVHRKRKIELASKRTWKKYWVCLRGNVLYFYVVGEDNSTDDIITNNKSPKHKLGQY